MIAVWLMIKNKPVWGSFWFSMALGVKAGALLIIPGLLGQIQYNHGTLKLFTCICVIVGFQILIALPFIL